VTARTVVYDTGMVLAMLSGDAVALTLHHGLRSAPHRPIIIGPVLAQAWRPDPQDRARLQRIPQRLHRPTKPRRSPSGAR
jgi:hypothetical protein